MSCLNPTAPINIHSDSNGSCDLKCKYSFKYNDSHVQVTNKGDYLSLSYEQTSVPPVVYNAKKYQVEEIRVYQPSLHHYSGVKADAEMVVVHNSGTSKLIVSIPISSSGPQTSGSQLVRNVLSSMDKTNVETNVPVQTNVTNFNLNKIVPMKPFYSYKGSLPYPPCNGIYDYVVFSQDNGGSISLDAASMSILKSTIVEHTRNALDNKEAGIEFFYNSNGPTTRIGMGGGEEDDIYIECHPTGEDGEILVEKNKREMVDGKGLVDVLSKDAKAIWNSPYIQVIIGVVLMVAIFFLAKMTMGFLTSMSSNGGSFLSNLSFGRKINSST